MNVILIKNDFNTSELEYNSPSYFLAISPAGYESLEGKEYTVETQEMNVLVGIEGELFKRENITFKIVDLKKIQELELLIKNKIRKYTFSNPCQMQREIFQKYNIIN